MWLWWEITRWVKNATKLLVDNNKINEWPVAEDERVDDTLSQWEDILKQNKPEVFVWAKAPAIKQDLNVPEKQAIPAVEETKPESIATPTNTEEQNSNLNEQSQNLEEQQPNVIEEQKPEYKETWLEKKLMDIPRVFENTIDSVNEKIDNKLDSIKLLSAKTDLAIQGIKDIQDIDWLSLLEFRWWIKDVYEDVYNYDTDIDKINYDSEIDMWKLKTEKEKNDYILNTYIPKVDEANIKYFKKYTAEWAGITKEQLSKIKWVVSNYYSNVEDKEYNLFPERELEKQHFQTLTKEVEQQHLYIKTYKELGWKLSDSPFVLMKANKANQLVAQELMQVENIPDLTDLEREKAKQEIIDLRSTGISALAMADVWKSEEDINKYLEDKWYDKRHVFTSSVGNAIKSYWKNLLKPSTTPWVPNYLDFTSFIWDTETEVEKIYDKYDKLSLERFSADSVWDVANFASRKMWVWYGSKIEPWFDLLRNAEKWSLAEHWMYDLDQIAKWSDTYTRNKTVDTVKKWTEIAAVTAATILSDWALSWIWSSTAIRLWASKAWQVALWEWLSSVFIKGAVQNAFVEWALKANFPTMEITNSDAQVNILFDTFGAVFDAANAAQKAQAINMWFIRTTEWTPWINILTKDLNLSLKEKTAIVNWRPAIERTVRALNKANPELASQMVKDSIMKKQLYRYIKKQIIPNWNELLAKHGWDADKAFKEFSITQNDSIYKRLKKYDQVIDPNVSALDFMWADNSIVNTAHDAPKLSDITKWKPKMVNDSIEDLINYYTPKRPNQTTKTSLTDMLSITPADNADKIIEKTKAVLDTDPSGSDKVLKVITHKDANWINVYFENWKQNDKFIALAWNKWTDFDIAYKNLATNDLGIALRNATNNWFEMVWEMNYDKIQYRKATDDEKANPSIPKFKVDIDMLVPTKPTDKDMLKGKKVNWRISNMQVTADKVTTLDVDWKSYVENPIKLNTTVRSDVKHTRKVSPQDAQWLYLDYVNKVSDKKDDITFIDDNDLYVKLYDSIDSKDSFYWHSKTSEVLDYIMAQKDTTKLLEVVNWTNWTSLSRFVNYLSSDDDAIRAAYIASYKWPNEELVKNIASDSKVWENIATKNLMADILVKDWSFNNKALAYKYVNDNYDELITYAVKNKNNKDKEYLMRTIPTTTMKFLKTEGEITNPLWEFFLYNNFPNDVIKQINKLADEYKIIRRFDMAEWEAWYIDHNLMEIAINGMYLKESDIFAHEFWHRINQMFTPETDKIINNLFLKDQEKAIKALKKKNPLMSDERAHELLSDSRIYTDKNYWKEWSWYIWDKHYQAMNQSERVAENIKKYLSWDNRSVSKEARSIFAKIMDWIKELHKKILWVKKTHDEFKIIMNNLSDHISEKVAKKWDKVREYLKGNINFYDKDGTSIFKNKITSLLDTSLAEELESWIIEYVADNWWLDLNFLNSIEWVIDMRSKVWTREYNAAKKVLHKYFNDFYNNNNRNLLDMSENLEDFFNIKKDSIDVTHEFLLSADKFKDVVAKNWFKRNWFDNKIKSIIEEESKKYSKNTYVSDMSKEWIDLAIKDAVNKFDLYLLQEAKKVWKNNPEKINKVMDVVANTNFSVPGKIYNFDFIPEENWNTPIGKRVFSEAYKSNELVLPLPENVTTITKRLKDFNWDKLKWPIEKKIEFIIDSLPKKGKSYLFVDYDTIKHREDFIKDMDNVPDVTLIKSNMNMVSLRAEWNTLRLWSYNKNAFDWLKETIQSIMPVKKDVFVSDTVKELSKEIWFSDTISEYFNDAWLEELPDSTFKYMTTDPNYLINLINSRKAILNKYSNYQFIDMKVISKDLENRHIIYPAHSFTVDNILDGVDPSEYKISRWFLETINNSYWFELTDANTFPSEKLELVRRLSARSYVSQNHADMMMAQLKLLKQFMLPTEANKSKYSEIITPLFHRNIMKWLDMSNRAIRWTVKNLVYNDLMKSGLPDAISSYIMRADEVLDFLIDNPEKIKKLSQELMQYQRGVWDVKPLASISISPELSRYLWNFYDRNRKELIDRFNEKTGRDESTTKTERDPETNDIIVGDNIFERSATAKKWLWLMFLNDHLLNVMEDTKRVANATNFHLYDPLKRWYYLKDNNIESFINWLWDITLNWVIKKENFNKILNVSNAEKKIYINNTSKLLKNTKSELVEFYKTSIDAWEKIAWKDYAPYFFKKEQIDNLFWEVYVKTRDYTKFLENNFWWTKALNTIISDIKKNTYSLDKFSRVTNETLELYKISLRKIMNVINEWQDKILKELESMSSDFNLDRLIKSWSTGKLTIGAWTKWEKLLITDWYKLKDFIKTEAEKLWYKMPEWFLSDSSTSIQQLKLVGMYADVLQNIIDTQAVWHLDKASIAEFFFRNSSVKNPFRWKEPIFLWEDSRINKYARDFWNSNHVPRFDVYTILNKDTKMWEHLFRFFKEKWISFDYPDNVANALDLTIKNHLTHLSEWYIRTKKYIWRNRSKDMKALVVEAMFKSLYDMFDKSFLMTFSKSINSKNKFIVDYVNKAVDYMDIIKTSRIWLKPLKTSEILSYLQKNNSEFKYLSKRLTAMLDALKGFPWNEAYKAINNAKLWLNVKWHEISLANAITNKDVKELLMTQLAKANNDLAEQQILAQIDYDLEIFGRPEEELNEAQQDMVSIEQRALDDIYWTSAKGEWYDPLWFAKKAKKKLYDNVILDNRMKYKDSDKYLDFVLNNKKWVSKYVSPDGTVWWTSNLKSAYYEPNPDQEFMKWIIEDNNEMFHSVEHPDYAKAEAEIMEKSKTLFDDVMKENWDLFINCKNL